MCNDIYFWIFDFKKQCVSKLLIHLIFVVNLLKRYENLLEKKINKNKNGVVQLASIHTTSSVTIPAGNRLRDLKTPFMWTRKNMGPKIEPEGHLPVTFNR